MKIIRLKKDLPAKIYAGFLYRVLVEREYINLLKLTNKCGYYDSNNLFKESKNNGDITVAYLENSYIPKVPDYIQKAYFSQLQFEIDD